MSFLPQAQSRGQPEKFQDIRNLWRRLTREKKTVTMTTIAGTGGNDSDEGDNQFKRKDSNIYRYHRSIRDKENEIGNKENESFRKKSSIVSKAKGTTFVVKSDKQKQGLRMPYRKSVRSAVHIPIEGALQHAAVSHAACHDWDLGQVKTIQPYITPSHRKKLGFADKTVPVNEIMAYLKKQELALDYDDLLHNQVEVTSRVRSVLVDWLIQVQNYLSIGTSTLYLTVTLIDLCLSKAEIIISEVQLLGITCLLIAAKFFERFAPEISKLIRLTDHTYTFQQVIHMELRVLKTLGYVVNYPTPDDFLKVFLSMAEPDDQLENLSRYLIDLSLTDVTCSNVKPSKLTASAIYTAKQIIQSANNVAFTPIGPVTFSALKGRGRKNSKQPMCGKLQREETIEIKGSKSRRMSYTISETNSCRRISVVLDNGDGRSLSITMDDNIAEGQRRVNVTAMECDEDVFACESTLWNNDLQYCTEYSEEELIPIAQQLTSILNNIGSSELQGARKKYANKRKFNAISSWGGLQMGLGSLQLPAVCNQKSLEIPPRHSDTSDDMEYLEPSEY